MLIDRLDSDWVAALSHIKEQADSLEIPFMVIGASARDMLLCAANISPVRATRDVDLAIEIASWSRFGELKQALIDTTFFVSGNEMQRLIFDGHLPIDLVPYGGIEENASEISWPPDHAVQLSVMGMKDAFNSSLAVSFTEAPDSKKIQIASAAGLILLKLIAWEDRKQSTTKDAEDMYYLLSHYIDMGNQQHLATNHIDLYDDINTAHARLLGRDLAQISAPSTLSVLKLILKRETAGESDSKLARDMLPRHAGSDQFVNCQSWLLGMLEELP